MKYNHFHKLFLWIFSDHSISHLMVTSNIKQIILGHFPEPDLRSDWESGGSDEGKVTMVMGLVLGY